MRRGSAHPHHQALGTCQAVTPKEGAQAARPLVKERQLLSAHTASHSRLQLIQALPRPGLPQGRAAPLEMFPQPLQEGLAPGCQQPSAHRA